MRALRDRAIVIGPLLFTLYGGATVRIWTCLNKHRSMLAALLLLPTNST